MSVDVIMPALGVAQQNGTVLRWLKRQGEVVTQGEPLLEIETDKATVELEAPGSGYLVNVTAAEGDSVPVGCVIARITDPKVQEPAKEPAAGRPRVEGAASGGRLSAPAAPVAPTAGAASGLAGHRIPASPKARRLARAQGVDLAALVGSGPGGAILAADVTPVGSVATPSRPSPSSKIWRLMAERTTTAWTTAPHFFLFREVDASRLIGWRELHRKRTGVGVTYTDLLIRLVSGALRRHPWVNARWATDGVDRVEAINIGVVVAVEDGVVVPVLHAADRLSVNEIENRRRDLVDRARAGRLRPEDLRDGTFTISNLGMYGVDAFAAIINVPEAAILAVGRISDRVVPVAGAPAVRPVMTVVLSCDHRVLDGVRAAKFLETLADLIEEPAGLVD